MSNVKSPPSNNLKTPTPFTPLFLWNAKYGSVLSVVRIISPVLPAADKVTSPAKVAPVELINILWTLPVLISTAVELNPVLIIPLELPVECENCNPLVPLPTTASEVIVTPVLVVSSFFTLS